MKILVTGFDPFGGESINPAIESVKKLPDEIKGAEIIKLEIPTVIGKSVDKIRQKIEEVKPDVVLSIGKLVADQTLQLKELASTATTAGSRITKATNQLMKKLLKMVQLHISQPCQSRLWLNTSRKAKSLQAFQIQQVPLSATTFYTALPT